MLKVEIASFSYNDIRILQNISFSLKPGEHLSILGESGCGKSTLLHLIYGLLHLKNGKISYKNRELLGPTKTLIPGEEVMKLVSQELDLIPFASVFENIRSFLRTFDEEKDSKHIAELLEVIDMKPFRDTLVKNLSGGQKQRVALAKAMANEPEVLLLDEAFSSIDTLRKNELRRNIFNYLKQKNISCIIATHDSEEALAFSDTIIMLRDGKMELQGNPEDVYQNVADKYQGSVFGDVNQLPQNLFDSNKNSEEKIIFPYQLQLSAHKTALEVRIKKSYFKGSHYLVEGFWKDRKVFFHNAKSLNSKDLVYLELKQDENS